MARGRHPTRIHIDPPDEVTAAKYFMRWHGREVRHEQRRFPGLTSRGIFGNNLPLEIDFGCGMGMFTCCRAKENPDINFLGIDKSQKPLYYAVRTAVEMSLGNIKFLRGDFGVMLPLLQSQTVSNAYYLFPNPPLDYHSERANMRRRLFFESIHTALLPGGRFYFATDSHVFFTCVDGILRNDLIYKVLLQDEIEGDIITGYRRRWEEEGRDVRELAVEKKTGE